MTVVPQQGPSGSARVLGHFPTGVVIVTAVDDGTPVGMAIGSFTSVSLDPPLIAILPAKASASWPSIAAAGAFCVNVLNAAQEALCRTFATTGADKFAGVPWQPSPSGAPVLAGALAWIDCALEQLVEAGDHYSALGRVRSLDVSADQATEPLVFFKAGTAQSGANAEGKGSEPHVASASSTELLSAGMPRRAGERERALRGESPAAARLFALRSWPVPARFLGSRRGCRRASRRCAAGALQGRAPASPPAEGLTAVGTVRQCVQAFPRASRTVACAAAGCLRRAVRRAPGSGAARAAGSRQGGRRRVRACRP